MEKEETFAKRKRIFNPDQTKIEEIYQEYRNIVKEEDRSKLQLDHNPLNMDKNRYPDVLVIKETAVKLGDTGVVGSDYINANFVIDKSNTDIRKQKYICCQAPLASTFNDFWRMIWQYKVPVVVMITNLVEKNRVKADVYWPSKEKEVVCYNGIFVKFSRLINRRHNVTVRIFHIWKSPDPDADTDTHLHTNTDANTNTDTTYTNCNTENYNTENITDTDSPDMIICNTPPDNEMSTTTTTTTTTNKITGLFNISNTPYQSDEEGYLDSLTSSSDEFENNSVGPGDGVEVRQVVQLHCTNWPDFGVPNSTGVMKELLSELDLRKKRPENPIVVHCSAGIGRTGTFVAIHMSLQKRLYGEDIDVKDTVKSLRSQRLGMVQSKEQYMFVYKVVAEILETRRQTGRDTRPNKISGHTPQFGPQSTVPEVVDPDLPKKAHSISTNASNSPGADAPADYGSLGGAPPPTGEENVPHQIRARKSGTRSERKMKKNSQRCLDKQSEAETHITSTSLTTTSTATTETETATTTATVEDRCFSLISSDIGFVRETLYKDRAVKERKEVLNHKNNDF